MAQRAPYQEARLLKFSEAAQRLRVSVPTLWNLIGRGQIGYVHVGRSARIAEADLTEYIDQQARLLKLSEAAERLGVSVPTLSNLIRRGQIGYVHAGRSGRSARIPEADLAKYIERLRKEARRP